MMTYIFWVLYAEYLLHMTQPLQNAISLMPLQHAIEVMQTAERAANAVPDITISPLAMASKNMADMQVETISNLPDMVI